MKLVFEYQWCGFEASGTETICVEYESIIAFQCMVLDLIAKYKEECCNKYGAEDGESWYRNGEISILGTFYNVGNVEDDIETCVYTLEDWFEKKKINK